MIVALGGQTPLKLAHVLERRRHPDPRDESRRRSTRPRTASSSTRCASGSASRSRPAASRTDVDEAVAIAHGIGYPVLVRPSYVLGGRAMEIVYDDTDLRRAMGELARTGSLGREGGLSAERPALVDRFLEDAVEVDVDALRDRTGECRHRRRSWSTSRRPACTRATPRARSRRRRCPRRCCKTIEQHTRALAGALEVVGLLNVQYAVKDGKVFVIEANPRASRTVPFVSKATGVPLAKVAARVMVGATLAELRAEGLLRPPAEGGHVSVKEAVLPFNRFPDVDTLLGPEMRSTGEVMGIDRTFGMAFAKSQAGAGNTLPSKGTVFLSLADRDKEAGLVAARRFAELGFSIAATAGTADDARGERDPGRHGRGQGRRGPVGRRRGRSDLVGQGRPRREHAARPRARGPTACTSGGPRSCTASPASRRSRPRSPPRPGIAEAVEPRARGALAAGATTATASCGWRSERRCAPPRRTPGASSTCASSSGRSRCPNPIVAASGTFGHGDELAAAVRSARPRRGHDEVGRRVRVGRQSAAARRRDAPAAGC